MERFLKEVKGRKVCLSFGMDSPDLTVFPAVAAQSYSGLDVEQAMDLVRVLAIQNEVLAAEFNEYVPLMDDRHMISVVLVDRLMRTLLASHAARKKGHHEPLLSGPLRR